MGNKREIYLDILHIYRSEMVATFTRIARSNFYGTSFPEQLKNAIFAFLKAFIVSMRSLFGLQKTHEKQLYQKNWLFVLGSNNYRSLRFITEFDQQTIYVTPYKFKVEGENIIKLEFANFFYLLSRLPLFFSFLIKEKNIGRYWDTALKGMGTYESALKILKKYQPQYITFSNDHTLEARAMILAAQTLNIPTFYIQHACIRSDFPPLRFTHSFLEGQDALDKYKNSGSVSGGVSLIGIPRMDPYIHQKNTNHKIRTIGICSNLLDDISLIESTLTALIEAFPKIQFTYRPHPVDSRSINLPTSVNRSDSKVENPFKFLQKQDLIIAGNTSIHYEAATLYVHAVYCKFGNLTGVDDMYGFVANGLVQEAKDNSELIKIIQQLEKQKSDLASKAKYYNATLGTKEEGKSQLIVAKKMSELLKNNDHPTSLKTI